MCPKSYKMQKKPFHFIDYFKYEEKTTLQNKTKKNESIDSPKRQKKLVVSWSI